MKSHLFEYLRYLSYKIPESLKIELVLMFICCLPESAEHYDCLLLSHDKSLSWILAITEYYPTCEIQFMNLPNIHSIRKSFHALRLLCAGGPDQAK